MGIRTLGAVFTALATTAGLAVSAVPAAASVTDPGPGGSLMTPDQLKNMDVIGACRQVGAGAIYLRLLCSNSKKSECSTRFSPTDAAGEVASREEVRFNVKVETLPYSVTSDNVNSATFRSCTNRAPVRMEKIELWNNFTVSGVKLDSCTIKPAPAGSPTPVAPECTIKFNKETFEDKQPVSCTNCSELNSDVYQWYARWSFGLPTRYMHESRAVFTGKTGKLQVSSVVDVGI